MYDYLKGEIAEVSVAYITIDVNGVGYKLLTPNPFDFIVGNKVTVPTFLHVREDIMDLYGFKNKDQRSLFLDLIKVNGIGPKSAMAIVATGDIDGLVSAIEEEDVAYLTKFPKIGLKGAKKMILELKGKLTVGTSGSSSLKSVNSDLDEAILALLALGYSNTETKRVKKILAKEQLTIDEYIKQGLKLLTKK